MIRLAVFDCDGTLIDSQASITASMQTAFARAGLPLPDTGAIRRLVGLSLPQAIGRLSPNSPLEIQETLVQYYKDAFRDARAKGELSQPLYSGVRPLLEKLTKNGLQLAIATGMSRRGLDHCLASHGLSQMFISLQTADRHPSKPHPQMLEAALFETAVDACETVMIGDTTYDMMMAKSAGVRAIGVDWGNHTPQDLLAANAEVVLSSPSELGDYLIK